MEANNDRNSVFLDLFGSVISSRENSITQMEGYISLARGRDPLRIEIDEISLRSLIPTSIRVPEFNEGKFESIGITSMPNNHGQRFLINVETFAQFLKLNYDGRIQLEEKTRLIWSLYSSNNEISKEIFRNILLHYCHFKILISTRDTIFTISDSVFDSINNGGPLSYQHLSSYIQPNKIKEQKSNNPKKIKNPFSCKSFFWITFYVLLNLLIGGLFFYISYNPDFLEIAFAKFFAGIIFLNLFLLLILACENTMTFLAHSRTIYRTFCMGEIKKAHKVCAYVFALASIFHSIVHLAFTYPKLSNSSSPSTSPSNSTSPSTSPSTSYTYVSLLFASYSGVTGLIILLSLLVIFITAIPYIKCRKNSSNTDHSNKFEMFWYWHKLYLVILVALYFHGLGQLVSKPLFLWIMGLPVVLVLIEILLDVFRGLCYKCRITKLEDLGEVIILKCEKPRFYKFTCGQYTRIKIPKISCLQYHPFTIASSPTKNQLRFYIDHNGNWKRDLKNYTENMNRNSQGNLPNNDGGQNFLLAFTGVNDYGYCYLDGPLIAPAQNYSAFDNLILIARNSGMTPFASVLRCLSDDNITRKNIHLVWMVRSFSDLNWMKWILNRIFARTVPFASQIKISIYISEVVNNDIRSKAFWWGLNRERGNLDSFCKTYYNEKEPDFTEILEDFVDPIGFYQDVGVFVCAAETVQERVRSSINAMKNKKRFKYFGENF